MLLRAGARARPGKDGNARAGQELEYDGVRMLEPEWTRCRSAVAHRMACELDEIRMEMMAMFESASTHQVRARGVCLQPIMRSIARYLLFPRISRSEC